MKKQNPTYVLFVPGAKAPSVYHTTIDSAREEAKRLIELPDVKMVMVCQFIEGIQRATIQKPLKSNPLTNHNDLPPF